MKKFLFLIVFVSAIFVFGSRSASAQEDEIRLNSSPKAFRTFFSKFRSAVRRSDKTAISSMTRFPFQYGFDAADEGKMSKTQFIKRFNEIFGKSPGRFLAEKNPLFSRGDGGSYIVTTRDAASLVFKANGASFKFTAFVVEP